jgi:ParB-like chromosome segregation protein Spo0J
VSKFLRPCEGDKDVSEKYLEYRGRRWFCPFTEHFRRHTAEELELMEQSIKSRGCRQPVLTYFDIDMQRFCILDGEGRLTIAIKLNLDVEMRNEGYLDTQQAFDEARIYNDHRRQDTPEEVNLRKKERVERVIQKRKDGKSIRTIAGEEKVSVATVQRDLESTVSGDTVPKDGKVVGKDGRTQPATRTKPPPAPPEDSDDGDEEPEREVGDDGIIEGEVPDAEPQEEVKDEVGHVCPPVCREAFLTLKRFQALRHAWTALQKLIDEYARLPAGEQLRKECLRLGEEGKEVFKSKHMKDLWGQLSLTRPYSVCPWCAGQSAKGCTYCNGMGWVAKPTWNDALPEVKARLGVVE